LSEDQKIETYDDDHVIVTATLRDTAQLEWWLRALGDMVSVIGRQLASFP